MRINDAIWDELEDENRTLKKQVAELEAKLAHEKESGTIANAQWTLWMDKVRGLLRDLEQAEADRNACAEAYENETNLRLQAEAALALSREQAEYANDAMMAMCKRAEVAEDKLDALKWG